MCLIERWVDGKSRLPSDSEKFLSMYSNKLPSEWMQPYDEKFKNEFKKIFFCALVELAAVNDELKTQTLL